MSQCTSDPAVLSPASAHSGSGESFASAASHVDDHADGAVAAAAVAPPGRLRQSRSEACCAQGVSDASVGRARSPSSSGTAASCSDDRRRAEPAVVYRTFDTPPPLYDAARSMLPALMVQRNEVSIWSILKHAIGKDLTRITMPIVFNEPLTFLQRLAEHMEYIDLLKRAAAADEPARRIELVAAFAVSALAANRNRVAKPFNPLLGETYELDRMSDLGFRYVCEQVSHHPPVSAYHVSGDGFAYWGSCYAKIKFFGQTVDCKPVGVNTLTLDKWDETYTWNNPTCSVHNLVVGTMYIEHSGTVDVKCMKTGLTASINFKPASGWFGGGAPGYIVGTVMDAKKKRQRCLYGDWSEFMATSSPENFDKNFASWSKEHREHKAKSSQQAIGSGAKSPAATAQLLLPLLVGSEVLWRANARSAVADDYYHFTNFALLLNEMPGDEADVARLPPTDSRRRPDVRHMDDGDIETASSEKHRLEEKQRAAAAERKRTRADWQPMWFTESKHELLKNETVWKLSDKYWEREWTKCPDIF